MSRNTGGRAATRWGVVLGAAAAALVLTAMAAVAEVYVDVPTVRSGQPSAIALDPEDPVPQIGWHACRSCGHERHDWYGHRRYHHYDSDERRAWERNHEHWRGRWPGPDPETALVDCSGRTPYTFRSVSEAAHYTPPNGRILIVPPGPGMTCVETVEAPGPVTIASAGPGPAVIQAPENQPCLIANVPLGDTLVVENVKFIARGRDEPCVKVQAGEVAMHNVHVDSRNTDWAFDVQQSGALTLSASRIETDGSGVRAIRANVHLDDVEIDVEEGHEGVGLALDRTDGEVTGGQILGGHWGAAVSAGPHGLKISRTNINKAEAGLVITGGEQGVVRADNMTITGAREGIVVRPGADAVLNGMHVFGTRGIAVALDGGHAVLSASQIKGAGVGVAVGPHSEWRPDFWDRLFHRSPVALPDPSDNGVGRFAEVTGNEIAGVGFGIDVSGGGPALIAGNRIIAHECYKGERSRVEIRENSCHDD